MNERTPIRIMLVDDHLMVRDGLSVFLSIYDDIDVVADAESGEKAIKLCAIHRPDVILMDMKMPGMDGPDTIKRIRSACPDIQIIALTSFAEPELVQRAIEAGAIGYLLKDVHPDKLARAIRDAHNGRSTLDATAAQVLVQNAQAPLNNSLGVDLTPREKETLALLSEGKTNKEMAIELSISQATVRLHVSNVLAKLDAGNRTEAAIIALKNGLV